MQKGLKATLYFMTKKQKKHIKRLEGIFNRRYKEDIWDVLHIEHKPYDNCYIISLPGFGGIELKDFEEIYEYADRLMEFLDVE